MLRERGDYLPPRVDRLRGLPRRTAGLKGPSHGTAAGQVSGAGGPRVAAGRASVSVVRINDRGHRENGGQVEGMKRN